MKFTKAQLEGLSKYKYSGIDKCVSILLTLSQSYPTTDQPFLILQIFPVQERPHSVLECPGQVVPQDYRSEYGEWLYLHTSFVRITKHATLSTIFRLSQILMVLICDIEFIILSSSDINPQQITFIGLCFVFTNIATLLYLDPTFSGKVLPPWVYFRFVFSPSQFDRTAVNPPLVFHTQLGFRALCLPINGRYRW